MHPECFTPPSSLLLLFLHSAAQSPAAPCKETPMTLQLLPDRLLLAQLLRGAILPFRYFLPRPSLKHLTRALIMPALPADGNEGGD
mmetsp:Transcript_17867/g.31851  ORF Transcript_17867/g.31851 Transcript_17867/m.31851 type:complete len:86 (+) Transcript_17867:97-354(+)